VEWVETTGRSIDEAKDLALDQLGVDEQEAEFEILEEPTKGLFGRTRGEARVRARILPKAPPPKVERRERRRTSTKKAGARAESGSKAAAATTVVTDDPPAVDEAEPPAPTRQRGRGRGGSSRPAAAEAASTDAADAAAGTPSSDDAAPPAPRERGSSSRASSSSSSSPSDRSSMSTNDVTVQEQAAIISGFLDGLVDAFGLEGTVEQEQIDDETIEVKVMGDDLGLLIGPKGNTLTAVQELARTVVQRQASGTHHGRVRIDVGGYRQRRREALERFTTQVADQVKESGLQKALEPMAASDRKVVHDTVNEIEGVRTLSEGEEPRRRVVIVPE
jgi:spoIIIJ-associated protein